jgi:hypothetical protein
MPSYFEKSAESKRPINDFWKITTTPTELAEGLFGQILLWTFELLPYLEKKSIYPAWDIKSMLYGEQPEYTVIPGVLDLAYTPNTTTYQEISFNLLRDAHPYALGDDWGYLHKLFFSYFKIPERTLQIADQIGLPPNTLGIHYRGTDKNQAHLDTNPVSQEDLLILVTDFLKNHLEVTHLFIATDEYSFVEKTRQQLPDLSITNLGKIDFFKESKHKTSKADRALVDCILLSRCGYVIKCSSALSGFAKILNPELIVYRIAASKLFADIPYFPDAYIPQLTSLNPKCQKILEKLFENDWSNNPKARQCFGRGFKTKLRFSHYNRVKSRLKLLKHLYA